MGGQAEVEGVESQGLATSERKIDHISFTGFLPPHPCSLFHPQLPSCPLPDPCYLLAHFSRENSLGKKIVQKKMSTGCLGGSVS